MKKFICKQCVAPCGLLVENNAAVLLRCPYEKNNVNWQEVREDKEDKEIKEEQLPDWCKVGEWLYLSDIDKYTKILACDDLSAIHSLWKRGRAFPARKRPFNTDEMKALVGKVLDRKGDLELIILYSISATKVSAGYKWFSAKDLMDNEYTIDGKPCYKLEHQNDKGKWVE